MANVWKINGTSCEDLGVTGLRRQLVNQGVSVVTFSRNCALDAAPASGFAIGDTLTFTVDEGGASDRQWFKGRVTRIPRSSDERSEGQQYEVSDSWWYLANLVFQQVFPLNAAANPSIFVPATETRAAAILGQNSSGARVNNITGVKEVLDYCIAAGGDLDYDAGAMPAGITTPYVAITAPLCAESIRTLLRLMPDACTRFDYATTPPELGFIRRADATPIDIALTDLADIQLRDMPELKVDHLVVQYLGRSGSFVTSVKEVDPVGTTGREFGAVVIPVDNADGTLGAGLAAAYRAGLSMLHWGGRIVITAGECAQTIRPGDTINITGGETAWETMAAQVQQVNEDIDAGRTEIILGPPAHLSLQDLLNLHRHVRYQVDLGGVGGETLITGRRDSGENTGSPMDALRTGPSIDTLYYVDGDSSITVTADGYGFSGPAGLVLIDNAGIKIETAGGKKLELKFTDIDRDMALRVIGVYVAGVPMSIKGLFSAPY